jgi:predicted DNA-binding protein
LGALRFFNDPTGALREPPRKIDGLWIPWYQDTVTPNEEDGVSTETKAMTLRLATGLHERLAAVAEVEGEPIAEVVRQAVADHVERRRRDPDFQAKLEATVRQHRRLLDLLGEE